MLYGNSTTDVDQQDYGPKPLLRPPPNLTGPDSPKMLGSTGSNSSRKEVNQHRSAASEKSTPLIEDFEQMFAEVLAEEFRDLQARLQKRLAEATVIKLTSRFFDKEGFPDSAGAASAQDLCAPSPISIQACLRNVLRDANLQEKLMQKTTRTSTMATEGAAKLHPEVAYFVERSDIDEASQMALAELSRDQQKNIVDEVLRQNPSPVPAKSQSDNVLNFDCATPSLTMSSIDRRASSIGVSTDRPSSGEGRSMGSSGQSGGPLTGSLNSGPSSGSSGPVDVSSGPDPSSGSSGQYSRSDSNSEENRSRSPHSREGPSPSATSVPRPEGTRGRKTSHDEGDGSDGVRPTSPCASPVAASSSKEAKHGNVPPPPGMEGEAQFVKSVQQVEEFIIRFSLDDISAQKLRELPPEALAEVMKPGLNNARNPSAVVWTRMKAAQANWARSRKAAEVVTAGPHVSLLPDAAAIAAAGAALGGIPSFVPVPSSMTSVASLHAVAALAPTVQTLAALQAQLASSSMLPVMPQIPAGSDHIYAFQPHVTEFDAGTVTSQLGNSLVVSLDQHRIRRRQPGAGNHPAARTRKSRRD